MMAHRAHGGGLHGQLHMAAVAAEPENLVALFEDLTVFQIFQQLQITLLVAIRSANSFRAARISSLSVSA